MVRRGRTKSEASSMKIMKGLSWIGASSRRAAEYAGGNQPRRVCHEECRQEATQTEKSNPPNLQCLSLLCFPALAFSAFSAALRESGCETRGKAKRHIECPKPAVLPSLGLLPCVAFRCVL